MADIKLKSFTIKGYKSIKEIVHFEPKLINILIGPNGAGKSNFISFFKFLSWMLNSDGKLQEHVAYLGGANDILHDGADITKNIDAEMAIQTKNGLNEYKFSLMFAKPDKWDLKSYRKVLPKRFERDFGIRKIVAANYINTDSPKATRVIGIKTISGYDKYIENCKEALAPEFRNYAHFEFIDLNQGDKAIGELLISQGEIIMDRDQPKM